MAAQVEDGPCATYIGPGGSGHFVKTVHNGIEYAIEQILAEAYDLMKRLCGMKCEQIADVMAYWNKTEELSSYLVEITEICLRTKDPLDGSDLVTGDEIGVFDGDVCVGVSVVDGTIAAPFNLLGIIVSAQNGNTPGYNIGNEISFRFWDASEEVEIVEMNIQNTVGIPRVFKKH